MWTFKGQRSLDVGNKQMGAFRASLQIALLLSSSFPQKIALNTEYYNHKNWNNFYKLFRTNRRAAWFVQT